MAGSSRPPPPRTPRGRLLTYRPPLLRIGTVSVLALAMACWRLFPVAGRLLLPLPQGASQSGGRLAFLARSLGLDYSLFDVYERVGMPPLQEAVLLCLLLASVFALLQWPRRGLGGAAPFFLDAALWGFGTLLLLAETLLVASCFSFG